MHFKDCIKSIKGVNNNQILGGLGELVDEKQKDWVRQGLKKETLFLLNVYR